MRENVGSATSIFTATMYNMKPPTLLASATICLTACTALTNNPNAQRPLNTPNLNTNPAQRYTSIPIREAQWFNMGYSINISFGSPPQQLPVYLDISSPSSWITPSTLPSTHRVCKTAPTFNTSASSTFLTSNTFARFHFDWLWGQGNLSFDTLTFGGAVSVQHQALAIPTYISSDTWEFSVCPMAGILGLAPFSSRTEPDDFGEPSPFVNMVRQNVPERNLFALRLSGPHAEVSFGRVNAELYSGDFAEVPLTRERSSRWDGAWQTRALRLRVDVLEDEDEDENEDEAKLNKSFVADLNNTPAAFSTGSPEIHLPEAVYDRVYAAAGFDKSQGWLVPPTVDCARRFAMPNVTFVLGNGEGQNLTLTAFDYTMEWPMADPGKCACLFTTSRGFEWSGEVMLGWAFMRAFYMVFDLDEEVIRCEYLLRRRCINEDRERLTVWLLVAVPS